MKYNFNAIGTGTAVRQNILAAATRLGIDRISFVRDKNNAYDKNTIKIIAHIDKQTCHMGYVPTAAAEELARAIDAGCFVFANNFEIRGGTKGYRYGLNITAEYYPKTPDPLKYESEWALAHGY